MHHKQPLVESMDRTHLPYSDRSAVIRAIHQQLLNRRVLPDESVLSVTQIRHLINTIFWASLTTEEARYARLAVVAIEAEDMDTSSDLVFADALPFSASVLVKLSPALLVKDSYLTIYFDKKRRPRICGLTHGQQSKPVIRATSPGNIIVSLYGEILAYLSPVQEPWLPEIPDWVMQVARFVGRPFDPDFELAWFLRFLAEAMRHGRGGTILIVPSKATGWKDSTKDGYLVETDNLRLMWSKKNWERKSKKTSRMFLDPLSPEATFFRRAITLIGALTAVDGATILNDKYEVVGFGRKIIPKLDPPTAIAVANLLGEPAEDALPFKEIGGTRHQSAACFANENPESIALVTSQDGHMTIFREEHQELRALRRCEALLPGD